MTSVILPDGLKFIEALAFMWCKNLSNINLPSELEIIGVAAFSHCKIISNIVLPYGIKIIETDAFNGCGDLTTISIPSSVQTIGLNAFENCGSSIPTYMNIIDNDGSIIKTKVFRYEGELTSIFIANGTTKKFMGMLPKKFHTILVECRDVK